MADIVTIIANISLALSFVVALIFGVPQIKAVARDRKERLTLEALRAFGSREFAELIHFVTTTDMKLARLDLAHLYMVHTIHYSYTE